MPALLDHDLEPQHLAWIREHVVTDGCHGTCRETVADMASVFPELKPVCGYYCDPVEGKRPHWWLVDVDGNIVDPTRHQFLSDGLFAYEALRREPTGKCAGCGCFVYTGQSFCGPACIDDVASMLEAA